MPFYFRENSTKIGSTWNPLFPHSTLLEDGRGQLLMPSDPWLARTLTNTSRKCLIKHGHIHAPTYKNNLQKKAPRMNIELVLANGSPFVFLREDSKPPQIFQRKLKCKRSRDLAKVTEYNRRFPSLPVLRQLLVLRGWMPSPLKP